MVRKKVRTQFLLLKKRSHDKAKSKNLILTFHKKNPRVKKKVRMQFLLLEKKSHDK